MLVQGLFIISSYKINYFFRDPKWIERLKEEYIALIKYIELNKSEDNDWFKIESNKEGTKFELMINLVFNLKFRIEKMEREMLVYL